MEVSQSAAKSAIMSAIESILPRASDLSLNELEQYCLDTLDYDKGCKQSQDLLKGHKTYQILSKGPEEQKVTSFHASSASGPVRTELRNHQLRFNPQKNWDPNTNIEEENGGGAINYRYHAQVWHEDEEAAF